MRAAGRVRRAAVRTDLQQFGGQAGDGRVPRWTVAVLIKVSFYVSEQSLRCAVAACASQR